MFGLTEQAVHEDKFACGPVEHFDRMFCNGVFVVQQRHVRCVARLGFADFEPGFCHRIAESQLKTYQLSNAITTTEQNVGILAGSGNKTHGAVQCDLERLLDDACPGFHGHCNDVRRQAHKITEVVQRDVKTLCLERFAFQAMHGAELLRKLVNLRGSATVRKNRKK